MLNKAVRMHGANDLRLDTFEMPKIKDDEVLVKIISDSICMSSYKAAIQGAAHKRVPANIAEHPTVIGHEFCGTIVKVGEKWKDRFQEGKPFAIQPAIDYRGTMNTPGYAFEYCGGDAQYAILMKEIMEQDCLLDYKADAYFYGSLAEPLSCIINTFHAMYHVLPGNAVHEMGIKKGGNLAILAGAGPMGLGAIDYAIHCDRRPGLLVVTDIDQTRLDRAASIYTVEDAAQNGVRLIYINTSENAVEKLKAASDGKGFDDILVLAPVPAVIEQADAVLAFDGCLNFFAGPTNAKLSANFNFYEVHYGAHHVVGTSGGKLPDLIEALEMIGDGRMHPEGMITHIGGLDAVIDTTMNLPKIPGGKKLVYPHISMELTAINDFEEKGKSDPLFKTLAEICKRHNMLWNAEAEKYLLEHAKAI